MAGGGRGRKEAKAVTKKNAKVEGTVVEQSSRGGHDQKELEAGKGKDMPSLVVVVAGGLIRK